LNNYKPLECERYEEKNKLIYICPDEQYSEYVIGIIVSELVKNNRCPFFVDILDFATCYSPKFAQYIFMERVDGSLRKLIDNGTIDLTDDLTARSIFTQLLLSIATYQSLYQVSHNDLHPDNIFIEIIKDNTIFNGKKLKDADYFSYNFRGKTFYFKNVGYLIKIGDWGFASKFSDPIILNKNLQSVDEQGRLSGFRNKRGMLIIPNAYIPQYDITFAITSLAYEVGIRKSNFFVRELLYDIFNIKVFESENIRRELDSIDRDFKIVRENYIDLTKNRPYIFEGKNNPNKTLYRFRTAEDILVNNEKYINLILNKPNGNIINIGGVL